MSELGIKNRRIGSVTILETVGTLRIELRFGRSTVTLMNAIGDLVANGRKKILLNLGGENVIGAKELGDLASTYLEAKKFGAEFKLFNLKPATRQLMLITKLSTVLDVYESEQKAIESFSFAENQTLEVGLSHS
ncbi:MAG TPA: STAS domain-containing protein [Pyrinomonadaceae bacterium]|nr:STAS domain-containing protein [Pyrinomonadaceae bacterium]